MDIVSYVLSKKYVDETAAGMGALKGAAATIKSIEKVDGVSTVTFEWIDKNGVSQTSDMEVKDGEKGTSVSLIIDENEHMIVKYSDGTTEDIGEIPKQKIAISKDAGNGIDMHEDGIYMSATGVDLSQEEGNILEVKEDGLYAAVPDTASTTDDITYKEEVLTDSLEEIETNLDKKYEKPEGGIPAEDLAEGVIPQEVNIKQFLNEESTDAISSKAVVQGNQKNLLKENEFLVDEHYIMDIILPPGEYTFSSLLDKTTSCYITFWFTDQNKGASSSNIVFNGNSSARVSNTFTLVKEANKIEFFATRWNDVSHNEGQSVKYIDAQLEASASATEYAPSLKGLKQLTEESKNIASKLDKENPAATGNFTLNDNIVLEEHGNLKIGDIFSNYANKESKSNELIGYSNNAFNTKYSILNGDTNKLYNGHSNIISGMENSATTRNSGTIGRGLISVDDNSLTVGKFNTSNHRVVEVTWQGSFKKGDLYINEIGTIFVCNEDYNTDEFAENEKGYPVDENGKIIDPFPTLPSQRNPEYKYLWVTKDEYSDDIHEDLAFVIGNGEDNENRSNAVEVDWEGNVKVNGDIILTNNRGEEQSLSKDALFLNENGEIEESYFPTSMKQKEFNMNQVVQLEPQMFELGSWDRDCNPIESNTFFRLKKEYALKAPFTIEFKNYGVTMTPIPNSGGTRQVLSDGGRFRKGEYVFHCNAKSDISSSFEERMIEIADYFKVYGHFGLKATGMVNKQLTSLSDYGLNDKFDGQYQLGGLNTDGSERTGYEYGVVTSNYQTASGKGVTVATDKSCFIRICYYDSSKQFISTEVTSSETKKALFTFPSNTAYFKFSLGVTNIITVNYFSRIAMYVDNAIDNLYAKNIAISAVSNNGEDTQSFSEFRVLTIVDFDLYNNIVNTISVDYDLITSGKDIYCFHPDNTSIYSKVTVNLTDKSIKLTHVGSGIGRVYIK